MKTTKLVFAVIVILLFAGASFGQGISDANLVGSWKINGDEQIGIGLGNNYWFFFYNHRKGTSGSGIWKTIQLDDETVLMLAYNNGSAEAFGLKKINNNKLKMKAEAYPYTEGYMER